MRAMTTTYLRGLFQAVGAANIPRTGALIICPNHSATLDPPMVPAFVPRNDTWNMAKSEYFRTRLLRFIYRSYHSFPVVRHTADRVALRRAFDLLKAGQVLIIYPEGTRVESGVLASPEPGAGFIAQKTGSPDCLPKGARWPRRTRVTITFGKPFVVLPRRADGSRVTHEEASDAIMVAIAELVPPDQRGVFGDLDSLGKRLAGVTAHLPRQGEVHGGGGPKSALPSA